jgi:hypothetical protein
LVTRKTRLDELWGTWKDYKKVRVQKTGRDQSNGVLDWAPPLKNCVLVERVVISEGTYIAPRKGTAFEAEGSTITPMWEERFDKWGHVVLVRLGPSRLIVSLFPTSLHVLNECLCQVGSKALGEHDMTWYT